MVGEMREKEVEATIEEARSGIPDAWGAPAEEKGSYA